MVDYYLHGMSFVVAEHQCTVLRVAVMLNQTLYATVLIGTGKSLITLCIMIY